jgi:hypothetical protein
MVLHMGGKLNPHISLLELLIAAKNVKYVKVQDLLLECQISLQAEEDTQILISEMSLKA